VARREINPPGGWAETLAILIVVGLVVTVGADAWVALHLAAAFRHRPAPPTGVPDLVRALITGRTHWDTIATVFAVAVPVLLTVVTVTAILTLGRRGRGAGATSPPARAGCDRAARHLARPGDLRPLGNIARAAKNTRLRIDPAQVTGVGLPVGAVVGPRGRVGRAVFASFEDTVVIVAGPRTNKTTAFAIPMLLAAPGAALLTSNKRDALDATRSIRRARGQVWVFDPQHVAAEPPAWWWDPVSFLTGPDGTPELGRATRLAAQLVTSATPAGARADAYFDTEKQNLIALFLLAAACAEQPLPAVWGWLCDPDDPTPANFLTTRHFPLHARALHALAGLPDRQRDGVYGSARAVMGFLLDPRVLAWITPRTQAPAFDPHAYAASTETLSCCPVTAPTAPGPWSPPSSSPSPTPWKPAPPHRPAGAFPSRSSRSSTRPPTSAASATWTRCTPTTAPAGSASSRSCRTGPRARSSGARPGWRNSGPPPTSASTAAASTTPHSCAGSATSSAPRNTSSVSAGRRHHSTTVRERTVLTPAELRELPPGRAVCLTSGTPAFLLAPQPWWTGPHADNIRTALDNQRNAIPQPRTTTQDPVPDLRSRP
jgi:hypothetical protein